MSPRERIAARYRAFARVEAEGRSPLYAEVAERIAGDPAALDFLAALPAPKRQPNLLFAVVRFLYEPRSEASVFIDCIHAHRDEIAATMRVRSTQTNEPARCATLLPALARLPQPLALLEVGASAGLCLLPDHYGYDYGRVVIRPRTPGAPVFRCRASANTPLPARSVEIVWRAGLDLHPIDLADPAQVRWLEALVWPGEEYRLPGLRAACELARANPPRVVRGDLRTDLTALADQAPQDATLVVFHTAVLGYLHDPADRTAFADTVSTLNAIWIANEGPGVLPGIDPRQLPDRPHGDAFLLTVDAEPTAWTDGHGSWVAWR